MADTTHNHSDIVSFEDEQLILVDSEDRAIGQRDKTSCHDGEGVLHRAFSLFVFNPRGELLLQQRSPGKRLWPGFWANSCCSHQLHGETMQQAAARRLHQELGMRCDFEFIYKFEYKAHYKDLGTEHELCHVLVGQTDGPVHANPHEIAAWRFVAPEALDQEMAEQPDHFTPWFKLEWARLRRDFNDRLPRPTVQA